MCITLNGRVPRKSSPFPSCGYTYNANAGNGRSFGPELEITAKLSANRTVAANAKLYQRKDRSSHRRICHRDPGRPRLPGGLSGCPQLSAIAPRTDPQCSGIWRAALALSYATKVFNGYRSHGKSLGGVYARPRLTRPSISGCPCRPTISSNARTGLAGEKWSATLFVDNQNNKVAWNTANNTQFQFNIPQLTRISTNPPRTFGTEINYRF